MWRWVLAGALLLTLGSIGLAWWLVPPWLEAKAVQRLTARLERMLDRPVSVGRVDVDLPVVRLSDLVIGEPDAALVRLDSIEVTLDEDALWSGRAEPTEARVRGGAVVAERSELEAVIDRLRRRTPRPEDRSDPRLRLVPRHLVVRELAVDVWEGDRDAARRRVQGVLESSVTLADGRASIALEQLTVRHESIPTLRADAIRAQVVLAPTDTGRSLRFPLTLEIEGGGTQVTPEIAVAGVDGRIVLPDATVSTVSVDLDGGLSDRDNGPASARLWSLAGRMRRDLSEGDLEVSMESFALAKVPDVLARLPLVESESATVGGRVAMVFGAGLARVEGEVRIDGLNVEHRLLARQTVRDVGFDLDFALELEPAKPRLTLHHATIARRGVELRVRGEFLHADEPSDRRYRGHVEIPPTPCQQVLAAIPAALVPSLHGFELDGSFGASVDVDVDFADLDALTLGGGVGIDRCRVTTRPPRAAAERLAGGFSHRVTMRDGRVRSVHLYPGSGTFTPLDRVSPYMVQAVLTTEDGGFWRHNGFLPSQFRTALHRNLEAGRIRLGASTITMQMVKNVLLSHERTLARKLQEMVLTWYVETVLTKERIMELYLNIVELGPGIYGVTRAARHYFGKYPSELTPPEAVYLALMLPSPVRRHAQYCRGELSPRFAVKVARILRIMNERGRLDDLDYEIWREVPVEFDLRERGDSGTCLEQIDALMAATEGQRALTGLLARPGDALREDAPEPELAARELDGLEERDGADERGEPHRRGPGRVAEDDVADDDDAVIDDPTNPDAPGVPAMDDVR